jgi:hypothetical protein
MWQGSKVPAVSHCDHEQVRAGDELLQYRERRAVCARAAPSGSAGLPSDDAQRLRRRCGPRRRENELVELANTGRRQLRAATAMRDSEMFQGELGRVEADLRAAEALLEVQAASHWRDALAGAIKDGAFMQSTQTAVWISSTCVRVADACFALAGGSALYNASPLQRRLRDIHVGAQHAGVQQRQYAAIGKLRLDIDSKAAAQ